ncbi:MAG: phosphoglycerate dehydrogenase [Candidatus Omnitrophota bacterium]|nr:phosphoglycerate dehydrogenase [Candidatus Omnitrophota bacterium]
MKQFFGEKILISTSSFAATDTEPLDMLKNAGCEVMDNPYKRRLTKPELLGLLSKGITGLIAGLEILDKEIMSKSRLKVISRCGSGMSNVDLAAAEELGITVCSTPDAPVNSVAELTLAAILSLIRAVPFMDNELHKGRWAKRIGFLLEGKTVVIVGFGRIGRRLSQLLIPFRVRVLVVDPLIKNSDANVTTLSLEKALSEADIISIHSSGNNCIIGKNELRKIKKGAFILNAARGGAVNEDALVKALEEKRIAGAWLDVFEEEPYAGPLIKYPQVMLTPHVGSYTVECRKRMEMEAVKNLIEALRKY